MAHDKPFSGIAPRLFDIADGGNDPRGLMDFRIILFRLSIAFMACIMILRVAGPKAKNGVTSYRTLRRSRSSAL